MFKVSNEVVWATADLKKAMRPPNP